MSILGRTLGNLLTHPTSHECRTRLVVDISDFPPASRADTARDIVDSMARGGGAADWCVTSDGIMFSLFGPIPGIHKVVRDDSVQVVARIRGQQPGSVWLCIHMREECNVLSSNYVETDNPPEYMCAIGVTDDASWMSDPRRHWDDYDKEYTHDLNWGCLEPETETETAKPHEYTMHTEYGNHLFEVGCKTYYSTQVPIT